MLVHATVRLAFGVRCMQLYLIGKFYSVFYRRWAFEPSWCYVFYSCVLVISVFLLRSLGLFWFTSSSYLFIHWYGALSPRYQSKAGTVTYQKIMPHSNSDGSAMTLTIFCVEVKGLKSWRPQSSHGWTESCQADWCVARPYPYGCAYGVGLLLIKWCFVGSGGLILSLVCVGRVSCLSC